jgi:hypothetical protein
MVRGVGFAHQFTSIGYPMGDAYQRSTKYKRFESGRQPEFAESAVIASGAAAGTRIASDGFPRLKNWREGPNLRFVWVTAEALVH